MMMSRFAEWIRNGNDWLYDHPSVDRCLMFIVAVLLLMLVIYLELDLTLAALQF